MSPVSTRAPSTSADRTSPVRVRLFFARSSVFYSVTFAPGVKTPDFAPTFIRSTFASIVATDTHPAEDSDRAAQVQGRMFGLEYLILGVVCHAMPTMITSFRRSRFWSWRLNIFKSLWFCRPRNRNSGWRREAHRCTPLRSGRARYVEIGRCVRRSSSICRSCPIWCLRGPKLRQT